MKEPIFHLDGQRIMVLPEDLDGDGQVGRQHLEVIHKKSDETELIQRGDMSEAFSELFKDDVDPRTRMSALDMRTNLGAPEERAITSWDTLVSMGFLPADAKILTTKKARYALSVNALGHHAMRDISIGRMEAEKMKQGNSALSALLGKKPQ